MNNSVCNIIQSALIGAFSAIVGYFDSTVSYLVALLLAFLFNILAGFRADEVRIKITRIFPPKVLQNFQGNKFKDSLMELFLIGGITYLLKGLIDLLQQHDKSAYVVQVLIALAIYYYVRNGLRNLVNVYPKSKWLRLIYHLLAFKFKGIIGGDIADLMDKTDKEIEDENK